MTRSSLRRQSRTPILPPLRRSLPSAEQLFPMQPRLCQPPRQARNVRQGRMLLRSFRLPFGRVSRTWPRISPRQSQSDAVPPAVIAGTPLAPTLPRIAQDQVATRPGPVREEQVSRKRRQTCLAWPRIRSRRDPNLGPEATIAREATPSLPSVAQDQVATRPAQAPGTDQATADSRRGPRPRPISICQRLPRTSLPLGRRFRRTRRTLNVSCSEHGTGRGRGA